MNCKYRAFSARSSDSVMLPIRILFHSPQYRTSLSTPGFVYIRAYYLQDEYEN